MGRLPARPTLQRVTDGEPGGLDPDQSGVYADWTGARRVVLLLVGLGVLVIGAVVAFNLGRTPSDTDRPPTAEAEAVPEAVDPATTAAAAAKRFARSLEAGAFEPVRFAFVTPEEAAQRLAAVTEGLGPYSMAVTAGTPGPVVDARTKVPLIIAWTLADDGASFTTEGALTLVLVGEEWQVDWKPAVIEASLTPGDRLIYEPAVAPRQPILDRAGRELVGERPVYEVSIVPGDAPEPGEVAQRVGELLSLDGAALADQVARSPSNQRHLLAVVRADEAAPVQAELASLPGVTLVTSTRPLTPFDGFGRALLGRSGEVTADILAEDPGRFEVGDIVGISGLQRTYNAQLSGLPGRQVRISRANGVDDAEPAAADLIIIDQPTGALPLRTTIDLDVQQAADQALASTGNPSSLVAIEASTGRVLAVANGPGAAVQDRALTGSYPPGSVFKIVTAYGVMRGGLGPGSGVSCPYSAEVDGRTFTNHDGLDLGATDLRNAFVRSCNTAFIELGRMLADTDLPAMARQLGVGVDYDLGTDAFSGSVPTPTPGTDMAAASFGQGRVLVSPLSMAVMAASVDAGAYHPPVLVIDEPVRSADGVEPEDADLGDGESTGVVPLDPTATDYLRSMMADVVNWGTGTAASGVPGGQVFAKTGTAEYGTEDPPRTHAWFVGFQNDIAFAVVVEDGGSGGAVAAPVAADFLSRLAAEG